MTKPALKVVSVSKSLVGNVIMVEAKRSTSVTYDSFLGPREFYLREGKRLTLRVRKNKTYVGDRISMGYLVDIAFSWSDIPWD